MSNLSELLPAGAGAKSAEFVASGTLGSGITVGLNADGTVEAVSATSVSESLGTATTFVTELSNRNTATVFDSVNNKIVVVYIDPSNSSYATARVGTISGSTISFGTAVVFDSSGASSYIAATFDSSAGKIVVSYRDPSAVGRGVVGTVSGTSISFGSSTAYTEPTLFTGITFDSTNNKVVIVGRDTSNNYGTAVVGTVSGTSISFGSKVVYNSATSNYNIASFASDSGQIIVAYQNDGLSGRPSAILGTVSGTSISFGSSTIVEEVNANYVQVQYDPSTDKAIVMYQYSTTGRAAVGTISGNSISFGTPVTVGTNGFGRHNWTTFDTNLNQIISVALLYNTSPYPTVVTSGKVSGDTISFSTLLTVTSQANNAGNLSAGFDSNLNKAVLVYSDGANSDAGKAVVYQAGGTLTNSADFIGITDQAIADTATGAVIVQGGVITNTGLIDFVFNFGADAIFESATIFYGGSTYDSTNNRVVRTYRDNGNSGYGTAVVGSVSGTTITWGTPVVFESAATNESDIAFDSANGKVVICYEDGGNSSYGTAIVGTVSGTSISFGSAVVFESAEVRVPAITYDANAQKVVIAYNDDGNSNYGTAIVGTVSGTSISFGSAVVFNAANTSNMGMAYDANAQKVVIAYQDGSFGNSVVGTVSGTSISFGAEETFESGTAGDVSAVYDPDTQKVIVSYIDEGDSNKGKAIVGTVSGTSISFGAAVTFADHATVMTENNAATYDTAKDKVVLNYENTDTNQNTTIFGTVSGTSISFAVAQAIGSGDTSYQTVVYDSNADSVVYMYRDNANSDYGTGKAASLSKNLTVNTDYYVQDDGTLSTTVSSVPAGRALSTTSILLEG